MKSLLSALILSGLLAAGCTETKEPTFTSANFDLVKLSEGVYGCIHKFGGKAICNAGFADNGKETIVFDSFLSPAVAGEMVTAIEEMGLSPIKYVVNSHAHNDHIRGNQVFAPEIRIISTPRTAELIAEWEPEEIAAEKEYAPGRLAYYDSLYHAFGGDTTSREYLNILMWKPYFEVLSVSHREIRTRIPDMLVDSALSLDGPDRAVRLFSIGAGHTESDLVMYLPDDGILFSGDLVFNECHPYMADGSVQGLEAWLDCLDTLQVTTVVPGHGPVGPKSSIQTMSGYVRHIETRAAGMLENNLGPDDAAGMEIPPPYDNWWFDRFYYSNLRFAFTGLREAGSR